MKFSILCLLVVFSASPLPATTPSYSTVNGYAREGITAGQTYFLAPANKDEEDSLEFEAISKMVERALVSRGLTRSSEPKGASIVVILDYGIGPPQKELGSYSIPTFGQTGVSSATTTGTISSTGGVSASTSYTPSFGITAATTRTYSYTTYDRWLRLSAFRTTSNGPKALWQTEVKSTGSTGDLRTIMPEMAFAGSSYIGTDTGKGVRMKVKKSSKEYKSFWGGVMPTQYSVAEITQAIY